MGQVVAGEGSGMSLVFAGIIMLGLGLAMLFYGKARNGIPRPFLQSYPVGMAYTMATMTLFVLGIVWIVLGSL